ncbi:hypothetical protein MMC26_000016 [Xylographa opegraphella]|nr:hypothetical protein [Xylographa opegraphella]
MSQTQAITEGSLSPPIPLNAIAAANSSPNPEKMMAMHAPTPSNVVASENSVWTLLKEVVTFVFQLVAVIAALVFGAWAIKSYDIQLTANDLASQSLQSSATGNQDANQLAILSGQLSLLAYCEAYGNTTNNQATCEAIAAALPLVSLASALSISIPSPSPTVPSSAAPSASLTASAPVLSSLPTTSGSSLASSTSTPLPGGSTSSSSAPSTSLSIGAIVGIVAGTVLVVVTLITACLFLYRRPRRNTARAPLGFPHAADGGLGS